MTTNNHPAHGPVSLDRLHQISEILSKAAAQSDGGNLGYAMADAVKVIDGAIASFGAEPVISRDELLELIEGMEVSVDVSTCDADAGHRYFGTVTEISELETAKNGFILLVQDAKPNFKQAGNSPVTPDGYVLVPIEPTENMIINGFESEPDEFFSKSEEWDAYQEMSGCEQAAHRAKLCWAAMIKAAPQQEVKS